MALPPLHSALKVLRQVKEEGRQRDVGRSRAASLPFFLFLAPPLCLYFFLLLSSPNASLSNNHRQLKETKEHAHRRTPNALTANTHTHITLTHQHQIPANRTRKTRLAMDAINARKNFEFINNIRSVNPETDQIYHFNEAEQKRILNESPWKKE